MCTVGWSNSVPLWQQSGGWGDTRGWGVGGRGGGGGGGGKKFRNVAGVHASGWVD
jgi:hypothetical protein